MRKDFYFHLLNTSWLKLVLIVFILYFIGNVFFGLLFTLIPNSIGGETPSFEKAFHFSVQTMSTIGYGALSPTGTLANFLVLVESFIGIIAVAVMTGIVFAKLSRPKARIRFSKNVLITKHDGIRSVCLRIGNTRGNDIVEAKVHLSALFNEVTSEGEKVRRIYNLDLKRDYSPFFRLSWLIIHPISETSPLFDYENSEHKLVGLMLTVTGHDGTYSTTVYDQHLYSREDIVKDKYFVDIMKEVTTNTYRIEYEKFDTLKD
ncbi:inward rectifier potassium channel [Halobacteriovorax sp. BALOs_7]|uniref:ion channel n=1 Tax=unclassified Halobacteriovorax TaxID=2639665 RepID=UPI000EA2A680|nr:ion channel [Halobacteriovorax sp. BALOs_7]AYF43628.1 inward rectifier potassium channel [Halobacteriovorax sp. BALOs_7]